MIELAEIKKEEQDFNNNIIKDEIKESKPSFYTKSTKIIKADSIKNENKPKINIYLPVNDINNMITMNANLNKLKFVFFCIIIILTLIVTNIDFIFFLGYLRPTFVTNKYYCYNSITKHYKKCLTDFFCFCHHDYCTTFCYETDFEKCQDVFETQRNEINVKKLINLPNYMRSLNFEYEIIYPLEEYENTSVFQRIGYYYCFIDRYSIGFIAVFTLGCFLGYYIFGLISDLYGRKKCIIILSILTLISNGGIMIISGYPLYDNFNLLITLWFIFILLLGLSLEPLESVIYVYFMEMFPFKTIIKPINSLLFLRYFISLIILSIFDLYLKNLVYYFYIYEIYLVPFLGVMIFIFRDTPRFFSERQDINNKLLSFFIKDSSVLSFKENENDTINSKNFQQSRTKFEENQRNIKIKNINYSYLYSKFKTNNNINKNYYIILFANIVLNFCFYTILLKFIFFFLDPHNEFTLSTFVTIFILFIIFYAVLQVLFYILFEIFSLSIIISVLLFFVFLFGICFDSTNIKLNSFKNKLFFPDFSRNNHHFLSGSLFFIVCIIGIYEMMLLFLSNTLYRSYFLFCQKGISNFSLIFSFIAVYILDNPILFISITSFFACILFLSLRVKWEKISLSEEINSKLKNL